GGGRGRGARRLRGRGRRGGRRGRAGRLRGGGGGGLRGARRGGRAGGAAGVVARQAVQRAADVDRPVGRGRDRQGVDEVDVDGGARRQRLPGRQLHRDAVVGALQAAHVVGGGVVLADHGEPEARLVLGVARGRVGVVELELGAARKGQRRVVDDVDLRV